MAGRAARFDLGVVGERRLWSSRTLTVLSTLVGVLVWTALADGTQPYETYEATVAASEPVAQYRFDDVAGSSTLADSAGSYTATNDGIVLGGEGPFGGARSGLFGGEAYASLASDPLEGVSAFTVEAWVDWEGGSSYKQPVWSPSNGSCDLAHLQGPLHPGRCAAGTLSGTFLTFA
jgi:hypothetical protein